MKAASFGWSDSTRTNCRPCRSSSYTLTFRAGETESPAILWSLLMNPFLRSFSGILRAISHTAFLGRLYVAASSTECCSSQQFETDGLQMDTNTVLRFKTPVLPGPPRKLSQNRTGSYQVLGHLELLYNWFASNIGTCGAKWASAKLIVLAWRQWLPFQSYPKISYSQLVILGMDIVMLFRFRAFSLEFHYSRLHSSANAMPIS